MGKPTYYYSSVLLLAVCLAHSALFATGRKTDEEICSDELRTAGAATPSKQDNPAGRRKLDGLIQLFDTGLSSKLDSELLNALDYAKFHRASLGDAPALRDVPDRLPAWDRIHPLDKAKIEDCAKDSLLHLYYQSIGLRFQLILDGIGDGLGQGKSPSVKQATSWIINDLPILTPDLVASLLILAAAGFPADVPRTTENGLKKIPVGAISLIDHPAFQEWLSHLDNFTELLTPNPRNKDSIHETTYTYFRESVLGIVVALSRTARGRNLAKQILAVPKLCGDDAALAKEWLRIHDTRAYSHPDFLTMGEVRKRLEQTHTRFASVTFFTSDIALTSEVANQMREFSLYQMPMDSVLAKEQRSWVWQAGDDFAKDIFNREFVFEGLFDEDPRISASSATAILNVSLRDNKPIDPQHAKRILAVAPREIVDSDFYYSTLMSLHAKDLPWALAAQSKLPEGVLPPLIVKTTAEILETNSSEILSRKRWDREQLDALLSTIETSRNADLVANSMYWLARTSRLRPAHALRVFDWTVQETGKHRIAPFVRQALLSNLGAERLLKIVSTNEPVVPRLRALDQQYRTLKIADLSDPFFLEHLFEISEHVPEEEQLPYLDFVTSWIQKKGMWPQVIEMLLLREKRDFATYFAASAVYFAKETGSSGMRSPQTRSLFEAALAVDNDFALLVPQKKKEESKPGTTAAQKNKTAPTVEERRSTPVRTVSSESLRIVTPDKSTSELLGIIRQTNKAQVALAALRLVISRNQGEAVDFSQPGQLRELIGLARWHVTARTHEAVATQLFQWILQLIENQFLFEIDNDLFETWSNYYLAFVAKYSLPTTSMENLALWLENTSKQQVVALMRTLQSPISVRLVEPPTEDYLKYLSAWFQKRTEWSAGRKAWAAAILAPAFVSPAISKEIADGMMHWKINKREDLRSALAPWQAPAQYSFQRLIIKDHPHFSFAKLKTEESLIKHAHKLRARNQSNWAALEGRPITPEVEQQQQRNNEELAIMATIMHELKMGRIPWEVDGFVKLGYDILSFDPATGQIRKIEVKSGYGEVDHIFISTNELKTCDATQAEGTDDFYFYLVDTRRALSPGEEMATIKFIKNPPISELRPLDQLSDAVPRERLLRYAVSDGH